MEVEAYLHKSRLFQHLRTGPHGRLVERYGLLLQRRFIAQVGALHGGALPSCLRKRFGEAYVM